MSWTACRSYYKVVLETKLTSCAHNDVSLPLLIIGTCSLPAGHGDVVLNSCTIWGDDNAQCPLKVPQAF